MARAISESGTTNKLLNVYFTAGYPGLDDTAEILLALQEAGADIIEIGLPYSDPLADGPTIQMSNQTALGNGMDTWKLFAQLKKVKGEIRVPVYLMGYYNQWLQFGLDEFCAQAAESGVYGLIMPDLPVEYFNADHEQLVAKHGLAISFLVTPETSESRMRQADEKSTGFVYVVSTSSTTGKTAGFSSEQIAYFERISNFKFKSQTLIGFGIHDHNTFETACQYANGAIIGSAFIRHISRDTSDQHIREFVKSIKDDH